ncbi:hypothetical protein [Nocardia vinacea]|uniref:hypothetical protein n=1 Tax=Nocardia vinacea TaxID=96468 RepID=UPI0002FD8533|nr:hypothetical protein [Nocardia vinacea]
MPIRAAHVDTGNVGRLALTGLIESPRYELTGGYVSTPGEVADLDTSTGTAGGGDLDALPSTEPKCVGYYAIGDTRLQEAIEDCRRILAARVYIGGSAPGLLQYLWQVQPQEYIARVEEAARHGDSSLFSTGGDPGFANDLRRTDGNVPLEQVGCMEVADYTIYDGSTVMFEVMGFGRPLDETSRAAATRGAEHCVGSAIRQLAVGLGITVDTITER